MDSKTRVMKSLNFEKVDRIGIFEHEFWEGFRVNCINDLKLPADTDLMDYFNMDIHIAVPDEAPFPLKAEIISETDDIIIERNGWGTLVKKRKGAYFEEELESAVKDRKGFDNLQFDPVDLEQRYSEWEKEVRLAKQKGKCVFGKIGGPFLRTEFIRGKMDYLADIAGDPDFVKDMVNRMTDHLLGIAKEELRRGNLYDTGIWIYDDIGCNRGPIMSPKSFEYIYYPAYKKLVQEIKKAGAVKVGLHCDGNIMSILDMLVDSGIEILNPIEPKAGMSIAELMKIYGKKLTYVGGMDNSFILPKGTKDEVIKKTLELLEIAKDGGVVIGAHSIGDDVPVENYIAYNSTVMNGGRV